MSCDRDLHEATHHVQHGRPERAVPLLLKVVAVLAAEIAHLKARAQCPHQSEPERGIDNP